MKRGTRNVHRNIPIIMLRIMTGSTLGKTTPEDVVRAFAAQHIMPQFYAGRLGVPYTEEPQRGQDRPLTFSGTRAGGKVSAAEPGPTNATFAKREKIITAMCYTKRHDYGLEAREGEWGTGMAPDQRTALRAEMAQLFEHHIEPILKDLDDAKAEQHEIKKILMCVAQCPPASDTDTWNVKGVKSLAWMANRDCGDEMAKITTKLRLKPGTPIEIILDTIQSIQQHAEAYRTHNRTLANGDRLISQDEYERLLAIERGHQTSKADAKAAEAAIERAHADINTFASEAGFPSNVTADGSRRATLRQVLSHLLALESEVELQRKTTHSWHEQMKLIGAALKRAGIEHPEGVWHVGVTDLATRYQQVKEQVDRLHGSNCLLQSRVDCLQQNPPIMYCNDCLAVEGALGRPAGTSIDTILEDIKGLREAAKPVYGEPPLMAPIRIFASFGEALELSRPWTPEGMLAEIKRLQKGQMQRAYMEMKQAFEDSEHGRVEARRKIETLRSIVKYRAPHTPQCCPPAGKTCDCWKAEFMAAIEHMPENINVAPEACPHTHESPTLVDCMRCGTENCHLRYGEPNGQPYSAKGTIA